MACQELFARQMTKRERESAGAEKGRVKERQGRDGAVRLKYQTVPCILHPH